MFNKRDAYLYQEYLTLKESGGTVIGTLFLEYRVTLYNDVQLTNAAAVDQPKNQQFILHCTKRITISNPHASSLALSEDLSYSNYPALLNTIMSIETTDSQKVNVQLLDYSPKTINTAVNVSGSTGQSNGTTSGTSNSSTVGSSTAETNGYSTSVSVGTMADIPTTSVTATSEHSVTNTREKSNTTGSESSKSAGRESSMSESMSIKDWGAYSFVNPNNKMPYWTFGQEVPWNAIKCRTESVPEKTVNGQVEINIPTTMKAALYDGVCLYPPSELSAFGVNFITKASWLVTIKNTDPDDIVIAHALNYYTASHALDTTDLQNKVVNVYRDSLPDQLAVADNESLDTTISLNIMALDPLGSSNIAAIVGFIPGKFIRLPANAVSASTYPTLFKVISTTNELIIQDSTNYPAGANAGFVVSQTALATAFSEDCTSVQITMYFKVVDLVDDYKIYFKHWKTGSENVKLTLIINDDTDNPITKYADASEGEGGEKNLLAISLRNQDYTSIEYHDYLQLGLNSIIMTIEPVDKNNYACCGYQVRAVSIETE
jgi:hypothetical protein